MRLSMYNIAGCNFTNNAASLRSRDAVDKAVDGTTISSRYEGGGALYITNVLKRDTPMIESSNFIGNVAYGQRGGAIHIVNCFRLSIWGSIFMKNR